MHKIRRMAKRLNDVIATCAVSFYDDRVSEPNGGKAVPLQLLQPNHSVFNLNKVNSVKAVHATILTKVFNGIYTCFC